MLQIGDKAPDFILPSTCGEIRLRTFAENKKRVLAFYIEDNTPGWTQMISSLKEEYATIVKLEARVIGISADSVESHSYLCDSIGGCPFPLASDPGLQVARMYDAIENDTSRGIRAIYLLDENGTIIHKIPWYQPGNVGQFMEIFQALGLE